MEALEKLVDFYATEWEMATYRCRMMEKLLDLNFIQERINSLNCDKLYIYGGGYLGIQLYRAAERFIKIPAIVDKSGKLRLNDSSIPVISREELCHCYDEEYVIITPLTFYEEIKEDLKTFVSQEKMFHVDELLGGL